MLPKSENTPIHSCIITVWSLPACVSGDSHLARAQLVEFSDDDYVSRVAKDLEELCQLVEAGFEYVTDMDGVKVFRKRK